MNLLYRWHSVLDMPKYDLDWHKQDMADELAEYMEAETFVEIWSELSDVAYTYTRARWSGHNEITFPLSAARFYFGVLYMVPKYTLRWRFFRELGREFNLALKISEVRNPQKVEKLKSIAEKYHLDADEFTKRATHKMKGRLFLK